MIEKYVNGELFRVEKKYKDNIDISLISQNNDVYEYSINISFDKPTTIENVIIRWYKKMVGTVSVWLPTLSRDRALRQWFSKSQSDSKIYYGAPILCAIDKEINFETVALSDAENVHNMACFVDDFSDEDNVCFQAMLFRTPTSIKEYNVLLRVDNTKINFCESIKNVTTWWDKFYSRKIKNVSGAENALYSTWYNFHQHPNAKLLEQELSIAKDLGFKTVILDDGWQFDGNGTGDYFDCGPWTVSNEKFPDFKGFVDYVHSLGMQMMVWFTVPFVGFNTSEYQNLKDKLLFNSDFFRAGIMDPRYPEVRSHIIKLLYDFTLKYDLDGLKLDFIDSFRLTEESSSVNANMDFESVEDAVKKLLVDIIDKLKSIKPEILIEFRQSYVGPSIVSYCNMLRVADCAFDSLTNRIGVADLRLPNYDLAVHSDMLYWSKDETLENIKKQLLDVLFSVPQISVLLTQSSNNQLEMIKKHIEYWEENKQILLHGKFIASNVSHNYTTISAENDDKKIAVLYAVNSYKIDEKNVDIFNATDSQDIYLDCLNKATVEIYDINFNKVNQFSLDKGVNRFNVEVGGMIRVLSEI